MQEFRQKLTDVQFRLLTDAQLKYNQALSELQEAVRRLEEIRTLVFDALGLSPANYETYFIDPQTQELVVKRQVPSTEVGGL
jgi:hypothetical protein